MACTAHNGLHGNLVCKFELSCIVGLPKIETKFKKVGSIVLKCDQLKFTLTTDNTAGNNGFTQAVHFFQIIGIAKFIITVLTLHEMTVDRTLNQFSFLG